MSTLSPHGPEGKRTFIYGLKDPETHLIRYIGKSDDPRKRLLSHLRDRHHTHKTMWLQSLKKRGLEPELEIIEEVAVENWQERERYWIAFYRKDGLDLVNSTDGGDGVSGLVWSPEERRKQSEKIQASPRFRASREQRKGYKHSEEARQKISEAGKHPLTEEHRQKISASHKTSPKAREARRQLAAHQTGKPHSAERRQKNREATLARPGLQANLEKMHEAARGRKQSPEERERRSQVLKGRPKPPRTEEERQAWRGKLSTQRKGKPGHPTSEETKRKIRQANSGRVFTEEHRQKLREARQRNILKKTSEESGGCG